VDKIATSFFVTNIPNSLDAKNLWKEFQPFVRIVDAFIANKRSKQGKRFGFVRFLGIHNEEVFAKSLSNVWIRSYHVFVLVAKFQRNPIKPHASTQQLPTASHDRPTFNTNNLPPKRSYASVTHAESSNNLSQQSKLDNIKTIQLNDDDLILVEDSSTVVLIKVPSPSFVVDERVIWIEVSGLPLCVWGSSAFKKIANLFGKFNFLDDDVEDSMCMGRACITTQIKSLISEKVNVTIKDLNFNVHVKEIETKMTKLELFQSRSMWGNFNFDYGRSMARGRSGGLVTMSDPNLFVKKKMWCADNKIIIEDKVNHDISNLQVVALDRRWSDHNPILLHSKKFDFGPTPFRIFHSWFDRIDFEKVVKDKWEDITGEVLGHTKSLHTKLKDLKSHLKIWYSHTKEVETRRMNLLLADMRNMDQKINEGLASDEDKSSRVSKLQEIDYFEKMNSLDLMQKALVKWEMEGNENSKFFHGLINSRRKSQTIHGIMHEGDLLEAVVSMEEIKTAVWDCGSNKAPGPDVKLSPWLHVLVVKQAFEMVIKSLEILRANFFWGSHESSKKLSWVKWSNTLASFDKGGLGVGCLSAFNKALLLKWRRRLFNFPNFLWVQVIKAFHGNEAGVDLGGCQTIGDGSSIRFWKDTWLGYDPLYITYNRLFHIENNKDCFISQRILNGSWEWEWDWYRPITMGRSKTEFDNLIIDISNMEIDDLVESDTCV
nr:hypothetical protein [Tanacetum cinerariifolium]